MTTELATIEAQFTKDLALPAMRSYLRTGDVSALPEADQDRILVKMSAHYGLDPVLRPFVLMNFNGKTVWYLTKNATDQLAKNLGISRRIISEEIDWERCIAKICVEATDGKRTEQAISYHSFGRFERGNPKVVPAQGDDLANQLMKAHSKAMRRVMLAWIGGTGMDNGDEDVPALRNVTPTVTADVETKSLPESTEQAATTVVVDEPEGKKRKRRTRAEIEAERMGAVGETQAEDRLHTKDQLESLQEIAASQPVTAPEETVELLELYNPLVKEHKALLATIVQNELQIPIAENVDLVRFISMEATNKAPFERSRLKEFIECKVAEYRAGKSKEEQGTALF